MRLEQMYHNVLNYGLEALAEKIAEESVTRTALLESMSKIDTAPRSRSSVPKLSDEEKAILKALGLTPAALKKLKGGLLDG
jgi:hypothetical protein